MMRSTKRPEKAITSMANPTSRTRKHPMPTLSEATWAAIRAVIVEFLAAGNVTHGFVAISKACRAARHDGRIPATCSYRQLDSALKFLADTGELGYLVDKDAPSAGDEDAK
jgi:hypothetical protein